MTASSMGGPVRWITVPVLPAAARTGGRGIATPAQHAGSAAFGHRHANT